MYKELEAQKQEKEDAEKRRMGLEKKPPRELPSVSALAKTSTVEPRYKHSSAVTFTVLIGRFVPHC